MPRVRVKDDVDLRWQRISKHVKAEIDVEIRELRADALDRALRTTWDRFKSALAAGEELHGKSVSECIAQALNEAWADQDQRRGARTT